MELICDGCGQPASPEHMAKRLARLEQATRFRPVHIRALLLGGISPSGDSDYLYAPGETAQGEAASILQAAGVDGAGRDKEVVLAEFQRAGLFVTHALECPLDAGQNNAGGAEILIRERLGAIFARIRRSLKPKRVILFSAALREFAAEFRAEKLDCPVLPDNDQPIVLGEPESAQRLRALLGPAETAASTST